uniref:Uncharacterized protein n=2 Tax=Oryza TaxID=4527 RepID=Q2QLT2_ORYSJ|nr:hypothetical protein LOC_Os12g43400 [Oryza sativa Japonica Group]
MVALKESTSKTKRRWRRWWHRGWLRPDTAGLDYVNDRWRDPPKNLVLHVGVKPPGKIVYFDMPWIIGDATDLMLKLDSEYYV